jgi:hypothetical protein
MYAHGESAQSLCHGQLPAEVFRRIGIEQEALVLPL